MPLYGSGDQVRDFTHVSDVVGANLAALNGDLAPGTVCNIGGGTSVSIGKVIALVEDITGNAVQIDRCESAAGDVKTLRGDITKAHELLDWRPSVPFAEGVAEQIHWQAQRRPAQAKAR